ncbi:MAG TPA: MAPEG family protein [Hyphomicrobiaceae bacterium]|jgi:hypothetical protein|nr:MAPEG family protein [Hyphomicrobiaceae bacterium]
MHQVVILYPVFVQVLLTFLVYGLLAVARSHAIAAMAQRGGGADLALGRVAWPPAAEKRAANQRNQFELPVLFYAVVAFALITKGVDVVLLGLAWLFVVSRLAHAAIHVGPNRLRWRSPVFALGLLILAGMWLKLFLHILTGGFA